MTTLATIGRNASANAVAALANGGIVRLQSAADVTLCDIALNATAFGSAVVGVATAIGGDNATAIGVGNPRVGTGAAGAGAGTACTKYQVLTSGAAVVFSGSGAELVLDNPSIATGQTVQLRGLSYTQPA
jgi:hypothetical protein